MGLKNETPRYALTHCALKHVEYFLIYFHVSKSLWFAFTRYTPVSGELRSTGPMQANTDPIRGFFYQKFFITFINATKVYYML